MKKYLPLILVLFVALPVSAADFVAEKEAVYSVPVGETRTEDLYAAGKYIRIDGGVMGDITIAANDVLDISGSVSEDVVAAGRTISIGGTVGSDVRAAAQDVTISGTVHGDVIVFGQTLTITQGAIVDGDILFFGETLTIAGSVRGEVHMWGGSFVMSGGSAGSSSVRAASIELRGARVMGDFTYYSAGELKKDSATVISGKITRVPTTPPVSSSPITSAGIEWGTLLMAVAMTALVLWIFAGVSEKAVHSAIESPIRSVLIGLAGLITLPVVALVLLFTVIGIPLGLFIFFSYGAILVVAKVLSGILAGALIARVAVKEYRVEYLWAFAGIVALMILPFVPLVGWIPGALVFLAMIGVLVRSIEHLVRPSEGGEESAL